MGKQKYNYRIVYLFMVLLLFMQGMTPLVAVAQTVTNDWTLEAIQQDGDQLLLTVKGKNEKEATIKYSDNVDLTNAKWQSGSVVPAVHIDNQNKKITLAKSQTQKEDVLILQTKSNTLQQLRSDITFTYGSQQLTFAAEQTSSTTTSPTTESTEKSSDTATQITSTSASTSESVTTENPKSSEETKESDTSDSALAPAATDNKKPADNPNDIRTYFPNGEGTIITDSQIFFTDKDGKPIEPPIPADATIRMTYDWAIPESVRQKIKAGDYFEFHLPAELVPSREMSGALKDAQGNTYANYVVGKDGTVRFTFTEDVVNSSDITGDFYFETHFETNHIDGPGDITIHYPTEDNLPPVDVTIRPATETQIDKQGHFDKTPNPSKVAWTVDINQAMKEHTNLTITETWPQGIAYDSVKVYELVMNLDGTVKEVSRQLAPSEYTVDQNGNVKIKGKTNNAYRLVYQSTIKESAIPDKGGKVSFTNEAALTSEEVTDDLTAKATVTNSYGKLLEKKQTGYNSDKQEFSWQIKYNYGEKNISKEQAVLTDTMSENLTFEPDSLVLHRITFDKNGKEIIGAELTSPADYQVVYDTSKNQFVLKFAHDVNYAVKIDYKTKVNTLVTGNTDVDNQVVVDTGGDGQEGGDDGTAQQQNIIKNLGNVDYANKTAIWKLEVNKNNYYMENAVITDTFQPIPGLSLAQSHLTESKYDLTIETKSGKKLFAKQDYDLTVQKNQAGQQTGFTIKFIGEYAKTTESFIIYYKTNFDVIGLDPDGKTGPDSFINHATITWTDKEGGKHHSDDEKPFKPHDPFTLNAQKSGVYNAVTKEITWTIVVNLSHNQLHNATLTDQIIDNQSYVDGSLKVFNAQTQPDGNVYINEKDEVTNQMQAIKEPTGDNDQTLSLHFPEGIANTYAIVFKTSLADKVIEGSKEYDNVADYENNNDDRKVTGEVSVYHGGETLAKEGLQDPDNPDYVLWHVTINGAQSTLDDVVITDHPSINQVLDEDSVVLYQTQVAEDGTITPDKTKPLVAGKDYTLEVKTDNETGQQTLEVKMAHIETAYYMEYRSLILSSATGSQDKVSNNVTIKGTGTKVIEGSDGQDVTVQVDNSGGNASGKRGKIVIQKTKEDGQTPLSGAHFQLLDMKKEHVLREGTVTEDGKITFGGLPLGSYKLVETQAPTGFTISDELAAGKTIEITEATTEEDAPSLIIKNEPNKVILKKVDEQGTVLSNAQFRLEKLTSKIVGSSFWQEIPLLQQSRTDENGILEVDGLETGIYRFVEVFAPSGFVRDETSHIFVVYKQRNGQIPEVHLTLKNYQGSATLTKKDAKGNPLAKAEFKVVTSDGQKVQEGLTSNDQGVVTVENLAPGKYQFIETKAPTGYVLNATPVDFTILPSVKGKPKTVVAADNFINYQGAAKLIKKDAQQQVLSQAQFKVIDSKGKTVAENLLSNDKGEVLVQNLAPGQYRFVETKAPNGYLLNDQTVPFEIKETAKGQPETVIASDNFVNYKGAFKIHKVNSQKQGLQGAEFTLYNSDKQKLTTATSDEKGDVTFNELAPGTYYFQETKAPVHEDDTPYIINPALIKVVIPTHAKGDPHVFNFGDFQNFKAKAVIKKVGDAGSVAGATFELYRIEDGIQQLERTIVVPESGQIDLDDLGVGSYKLIEIKAAPGYVVNSQAIYFVVNEEGQADQSDQMDFNNYQAEIIGHKVDEDKKPLAGAKFAIYASQDGQKVGEALTVLNNKGEATQEITTDDSGEIYAKGLAVGEYVLVETKAPAGFIQDTTPHTFAITAQQGKPVPVELGDFINYQGQASLKKTDDKDNPLAQAVFQVIDDAGKIVAKDLVTNEKGLVQVDQLAPGNYQFVEVKSAPGYILNTEKIPFTIAEKNEGQPDPITVAMINYKGSVTWQKTDEKGQGLAGAVFHVKDDTTHKSVTVTVDKTGHATLTDLAPGTYTIKEAKAPTGYQLSEKTYQFVIPASEKGKPETLVLADIVNHKLPPEDKPKQPTPTDKKKHYPKTNDQNNYLLVFVGFVLIAFSTGLILRKRK